MVPVVTACWDMRADATAQAGWVPAIGVRAVTGAAMAAELSTPPASTAAAAVVTTTRNRLVTLCTSYRPFGDCRSVTTAFDKN
jgi:hypothetical protein